LDHLRIRGRRHQGRRLGYCGFASLRYHGHDLVIVDFTVTTSRHRDRISIAQIGFLICVLPIYSSRIPADVRHRLWISRFVNLLISDGNSVICVLLTLFTFHFSKWKLICVLQLEIDFSKLVHVLVVSGFSILFQ